MRYLIIVTLAFICVCFQYANAQITSIAIPVDKDSYVDSDVPNTNHGTNASMVTGTNRLGKSEEYHRSYVHFDLDTIPDNAIIKSAKLKLVLTDTINGQFVTHLVTEEWTESGGGSITFNNQPDFSLSPEDFVSGFSQSDDTIRVSVDQIIKNSKWGLKAYQGFVVRMRREITANVTGAKFFTKESAFSSNYPVLEVEYILPHVLANVEITHESDTLAEDAVIDLDVLNGSQDFNWEWVDSAGTVLSTDTILDSIGFGWYGLHIEGASWTEEDFYYGFLVGIDCRTVDINVRTSSDYSDFAYVLADTVGGVNYSNTNWSNTNDYITKEWNYSSNWAPTYTYDKVKLWMDDAFTVNSATYNLYGVDHFISPSRENESEFLQVTSSWNKNSITYFNQPTTSSSVAELGDMSTSVEDNSANLKDIWDYWKTDNWNNNLGLKYQLTIEDSSYNVRNNFASPGYATVNDRPLLQFNLNLDYNSPLVCDNDAFPYQELKKKLDGGYGISYQDVLKFTFNEPYSVDTSLYLQVNLYGDDKERIASCDASGTTSGGMTALNHEFDDNRYSLDLTGITALVDEEYYLLEVFNSKGDKYYLKFKHNE